MSVIYNGSAQTPCTATVTGAGGLNQPLSVTYTDNTNAGTATASASYAGDSNHTGSSGSANFTIGQAVGTVALGNLTQTYTGSELAPLATTTPPDLAVTWTGAPQTNAGSYQVTVTVNDSNYMGTATGTFTIAQAPSTVTVSCPASVIYTGSAQTPCTAAVTGAGGLSQSLPVISYENNINVGTATASASWDGDANHNGSSDIRTFLILPWTLKGFYKPVDMSIPPTLVYNTAKNGSTVPLKFEAFAGLTEIVDIASIKSLTYAQIACVANVITDDVETLATGNTALHYDATAGQFTYNWKTPSTANKCYRVTMTTQDGSSLVSYFKLK